MADTKHDDGERVVSNETPRPLKGHERHIQHTHAGKAWTAWCRAELTQFDWTFTSIDHATYAIQQDQRLAPCPACVAVVVRILTEDTETDP